MFAHLLYSLFRRILIVDLFTFSIQGLRDYYKMKDGMNLQNTCHGWTGNHPVCSCPCRKAFKIISIRSSISAGMDGLTGLGGDRPINPW